MKIFFQKYKPLFFLLLFLCGFVWEMSANRGRRHCLPRIDRQALLREDSLNNRYKIGGMRFAKRFEVNLNPANAGETHTLPDGRQLWLLNIVSEEAYSLNLFFDKFKLNAGDTVFIYNRDLSQIFTLTENDNLQSGSLPLAPLDGDELTVELHTAALDASELNISRINHDYRGFRLLPIQNSETDDNCSAHASCVPELSQIKQSVCVLIIDGQWLCTGTLINNTAQDGKPYILSAAHCFMDENNNFTVGHASTTVAFFNYEAPNCQSNIRGSMEFAIGGANMRAWATDIDFALIELTKAPPVDFRPYYAGWNLGSYPSPPFKGIHHPSGTIKRVANSTGNLTIASFYVQGLTFMRSAHWKTTYWAEGTTQPGSSGSGLFDSNLRLVGALSGGSSQCGNGQSDYYYRLNKAWDNYPEANRQLKRWLDPFSTGQTALDGLNPYGKDSAFRISNLTFNEPVRLAYLTSYGNGLAVGQNTLGTTEYAEQFSVAEPVFLHGFHLVPAKGTVSKMGNIKVRVYAPTIDNLLVEMPIALENIQYNGGNFVSMKKSLGFIDGDNYIHLPESIEVGTNFYISYEVPPIPVPMTTDSFAVYTAKNRTSGAAGSVLARQGDVWESLSSLTGLHTALWIDPIVSYGIDTSNRESQGQWGKSIVFPNPANPQKGVNLRISLDRQKESECTLELYNYSGRKIAEKILYGLESDIPLQDFLYVPSSVYLLRINYWKDGKIIPKKSETIRVLVNNPK